ncbi:hypothetical protein pb186bvf_010803 [Paramecium bursaria]
MFLFFIQLCRTYKILDNKFNTSQVQTKTFNLNDLNLVQGSQYTIYTELQADGNSEIYMGYCWTSPSLSSNIISNYSQILQIIQLNSQACVFDNNAVIYNRSSQLITLQNQLTESNFNKFGMFNIQSQRLTLYIYSPVQTQYSLSIDLKTQIGCDQGYCNGICQQNVCVCDQLSNNCDLQAINSELKQQQTISLDSKTSKLLEFKIQNYNDPLYLNIQTNQEVFIKIGCYLQYNFVPSRLISQWTEIPITANTAFQISQSDIFQCQNLIKSLEGQLRLNLSQKLIISVYTNINTNFTVIMTFDTQISLPSTSDNSYVVYYVWGCIGGVLLFAIILIVCLVIMQRQRQRAQIQIKQITHQLDNSQFVEELMPNHQYIKALENLPGLAEINECAICLSEFKKQDFIRITACIHIFHTRCLDQWIKRKNDTCPTCRQGLIQDGVQAVKLGHVVGDEMIIDQNQIESYNQREKRLLCMKGSPQSFVYKTCTSITRDRAPTTPEIRQIE